MLNLNIVSMVKLTLTQRIGTEPIFENANAEVDAKCERDFTPGVLDDCFIFTVFLLPVNSRHKIKMYFEK